VATDIEGCSEPLVHKGFGQRQHFFAGALSGPHSDG